MTLARVDNGPEVAQNRRFRIECSSYSTFSIRFPVETAAATGINLAVPADMNFDSKRHRQRVEMR